MRALVFAAASGMASLSLQVSILIWPKTFEAWAPYVKWMWVLTGVLLLVWAISHPKILKGWLGSEAAQPEQAVKPHIHSVINPQINPHISVAPVINLSPVTSSEAELSRKSPLVVEQSANHNLVLDTYASSVLVIENDTFTASPHIHSAPPNALIAQFYNEPSKERDVDCAEDIKAALVAKCGHAIQRYSPLAWIDEFYNTVDISPGDLKALVIAVELRPKCWYCAVNRRSGTQSPVGLEFASAPSMDADLELQLIDSRGRIIESQFCQWALDPETKMPRLRYASGHRRT